jgi:hypothetical protein
MDLLGPWSEQWIRGEGEAADVVTPSTGAIALAVEETVTSLGLPLPKVTIANEDGVIGLLLRRHEGGFVTLQIGVGGVRGEITLLLPVGTEGVRFVFDSAEAKGAWEPLYRFFVALAARLGARPQRPPAMTAPADLEALRDTLRASLDACASDCLFAEGLATYALELHVESRDPQLVTSAVGAGHGRSLRVTRGLEAIDVAFAAPGLDVHATLGGHSVLLSDSGLEVLEAALRDDWAAATGGVSRAFRLRTAPPPASEAAHFGSVVAFACREDGARKQLDPRFAPSLSAFLQEHLQTASVEVIRYFGDGLPFWKAAFAQHTAVPALRMDKHLDELFEHRTWQWRPGERPAASSPPPSSTPPLISLRLA